MLNPPPFKLASSAMAAREDAASERFAADRCCSAERPDEEAPTHGRTRLGDLNQHLHCSVLGTCLGTAELRKLMARFIDLNGASDLEVHHEAVRLVGDEPRIARALHERTAPTRLRRRAHAVDLVGAANRADIRRLVALERDNADLHERLERQEARWQRSLEERNAAAEILASVAVTLRQELRSSRGPS